LGRVPTLKNTQALAGMYCDADAPGVIAMRAAVRYRGSDRQDAMN
jgi:hypothetical protein